MNELPPDSLEARYFEKSSNQNDNDVRLLSMRVDKRPKIVATNEKPASGKLLSTSIKLVQDKLLPGFLKAKNLKNSSDQDDNNIRLPPVRADKGPRTTIANRKPGNGKLSLVLTKLVIRIGQDVWTKKVLILKIG